MKCKHLNDTRYVEQEVTCLDDGWTIDGCCGGGCVVIRKIRYCPFCGKNIMPRITMPQQMRIARK